jgi:hypothetical protein
MEDPIISGLLNMFFSFCSTVIGIRQGTRDKSLCLYGAFIIVWG